MSRGKRTPLTEEQRVKAREATRRWKKNNPDKVLAAQKRYIEKHKDRLYPASAAWKRKNRALVTEQQRSYMREYRKSYAEKIRSTPTSQP